MITLDSKIQKGEKEKEMKNKKLWIFGGIILLIVILNHIFDWSSYISTAENLEFMKRIVQNNLPLAILLYMVLTCWVCGACASGSDVCDTGRTSLWTSNRYDLLFSGNNDRGGSCIYCRTFFLERQYWTSGCKKTYLEKMVV